MSESLSGFPLWKAQSPTPASDAEGMVMLVDKPLGWTSFDVVRRLRNLLTRQLHQKKLKVGHAGTLDPLATGLMIICTGKATRLITGMTEYDKEYVAQMELGRTTPSFDLETRTDGIFPTDHVTPELLDSVVASFIGKTMQEPPLFSAKKIGGVRAYSLARKGDDTTLEARPITITAMEVLQAELPLVTLRIRCSKGTYIRALVRDLGRALRTGACMTSLRRTAIGPFKVSEAVSMEGVDQLISTMN